MPQEEIDRNWIYFCSFCRCRADGPHLGAEVQSIPIDSIIEQLDSEWIPTEEQPLLAYIPNRQPEHAVEAIQNLIAPLLISVDDYLGVRVRTKHMPVPFQFAP